METNRDHISRLVDKLAVLSPARIAEVEDFIDFLKQRDQDRQLTHAAAKAAEPTFGQIWDNPSDAVYDDL